MVDIKFVNRFELLEALKVLLGFKKSFLSVNNINLKKINTDNGYYVIISSAFIAVKYIPKKHSILIEGNKLKIIMGDSYE